MFAHVLFGLLRYDLSLPPNLYRSALVTSTLLFVVNQSTQQLHLEALDICEIQFEAEQQTYNVPQYRNNRQGIERTRYERVRRLIWRNKTNKLPSFIACYMYHNY